MEVDNKIKCRLSKTKYIVVKTGKEKENDISEQVTGYKNQEIQYLVITVNEEGILKGHIKLLLLLLLQLFFLLSTNLQGTVLQKH